MFYDHEIIEELRKSNERHINGYAILFDIKDSTKRKKDHPEKWYEQTRAFYKAVDHLSTKIMNDLGDESKVQQNHKKPVLKFSGDSGFIFIPRSYATTPHADTNPDPKFSAKILEYALRFRLDTHNQREMGGVRLKTVVAYLTNVRPVEFSQDRLDVVARGIDFVFRLEKYADEAYIILNQLLYASLEIRPRDDGGYGSVVSINGINHQVVPCRRFMKGWHDPNGETFYLLTPPAERMDEHTKWLQKFISPEREDLLPEYVLAIEGLKAGAGAVEEDAAERGSENEPS